MKNENENKNMNLKFSKTNYCNYYPKRNEINRVPDKKPLHFPLKCFHGVNYFHNEIGNKEYLDLTSNNKNNTIDSYKIIDKKDHLYLNHLCNKNINKKNIINSTTIKFRHKNTTFLYYC
jgi:hypothetical protein